MPASDTVPSPLKFLGRIPGKPGELTYAKDIYRYYEALAKASPRAKFWKIGQTEEGRDQVILAIADEATIKDLDKYKDILSRLGDPRGIQDEAAARELIKTGKPLYWVNSGIHSPETGGPEMLIELAYRLIVEESPFIQTIRNNSIVFITPVIDASASAWWCSRCLCRAPRGPRGRSPAPAAKARSGCPTQHRWVVGGPCLEHITNKIVCQRGKS
jgi:hypothetical protein